MSKRTDIRNKLKEVLQAVEGIAADSVMIGRGRSVPPHKMPALCVYTEIEEKETASLGLPRNMDRKVTLQVEIHVQARNPEQVEDDLDAWCDKVETALLADESLGGLSREIIPLSDQYTLSEEGQKPAGVAISQYDVIYS